MTTPKWINYTQFRHLSYKKLMSWYSGLVKAKPQEAPFSHIVQIGDPTLRTVSDEIPPHLIKSPEVKFLINRMKNVMKRFNCVGLSAPQIGIPVRLILLEFNKKHMKGHSSDDQKIKEMEIVPFMVVVNPEMKVSDYTKVIFPETCESVKGFHADVPRFRGVELRGLDAEAKPLKLQSVGWPARIIQHEMDHLDGKLYTDVMERRSLACSCWQAVNDRGGKIELPYGAQ